MVDILQVLEGLAYVGFIAGAIFAVLELRGISKDRRVSIVVGMYNSFISGDMPVDYSKVIKGDFQNAADMEQKCSHSSLVRIAGFFEGAGYLVRKKIVYPKVVMDYLPIAAIWHKMQPWVLYDRERTGPGQWSEFEYLAMMTEDYDSEYLADYAADFEALKARRKRRAA